MINIKQNTKWFRENGPGWWGVLGMVLVWALAVVTFQILKFYVSPTIPLLPEAKKAVNYIYIFVFPSFAAYLYYIKRKYKTEKGNDPNWAFSIRLAVMYFIGYIFAIILLSAFLDILHDAFFKGTAWTAWRLILIIAIIIVSALGLPVLFLFLFGGIPLIIEAKRNKKRNKSM